MKIGPKLVTIIKRMKFFAQGFSRAGVYHSVSNGQIWADAVAGKFAVSLKALGKKFHSFDCCDQFRSYFHNFKRFPLGFFFEPRWLQNRRGRGVFYAGMIGTSKIKINFFGIFFFPS